MARRLVHIVTLLVLFLAGMTVDGIVQARPSAEVDIGGRDLGYVEGFSAKEWSAALPAPAGPEAGTFRWMGAAGTIHLGPLEAGRPLLLCLRMARPAGPPFPAVQLYAGGRLQAVFPLGPLLQEYCFLLPPDVLRGNNLEVSLQVATFRVEGDARDLGLVLERARAQVHGAPTTRLGQALRGILRPAGGLAVLAAVLLALALGMPFEAAGLLGLGLLALAGGIGLWRPDLLLRVGPTLAVLLVLAAVLAGIVRLGGQRFSRLAGWLGRHAHWVLLGFFLLALLLCFFPHIEADGIEYYAYLRSLAFDGNLHFADEFSPEMEKLFPHIPYGLSGKKTPTGYEPNYASVGPAIVWAPFFVIGHLLALAGHALGLPWTLDGYSEPYIVLIGFGSALSGLVTLLLGYDLVQRLYGRALGLLATVATFIGTTAFYYVFYKPDFAHALAACAVTAFVYLWLRTREKRTWPQWLSLGLLGGLMTTMYWIDAIFILLPATELIREFGQALIPTGRKTKDQRPNVARAIAGGALLAGGFVVGFAPQMIAWKIIFGKWLTVPQEGFATPSGFAAPELLLSPLHGLLPWTPIAVVGMIGLLFLAWKQRPWGLWLLLALAAFFLYNATLGSWHGGGTFGLRRLTNAYPFFLLGVAALLSWLRNWRREAAVVAAGLPAFWGAVTLLRYLAYTIPHYPSELEGLSLAEFLLAPNNMPLAHLPGVLRLSFFWQWLTRLTEQFKPADLGYGLILLALFVGAALALTLALRRWGIGNGKKEGS